VEGEIGAEEWANCSPLLISIRTFASHLFYFDVGSSLIFPCLQPILEIIARFQLICVIMDISKRKEISYYPSLVVYKVGVLLHHLLIQEWVPRTLGCVGALGGEGAAGCC